MEKFLPILNFMLRFKFFRDRILQSVVHPIYLQVALDQAARNMKVGGLEHIADPLSKLTLVVYVQLMPTRELIKGAKLKWQLGNVQNAKSSSGTQKLPAPTVK